MIHLRVSSLPLNFVCPGSARAPTVVIRDTSEPANVGTAMHEALRPLVELGSIDWALVDAIAATYDADHDDVRVLVAIARTQWTQLATSFPNARTEASWRIEGSGFVLTGHTDVDSQQEGVVRILDWKSGRKDYDYGEQMRGYCALAISQTDAWEATSTIVWVRTGEVENYTMSRNEVPFWLDRLRREVVEWDGVYHPGTHCMYCPRAHECEAVTALVRKAAAPFTRGDQSGDLSTWSDEKILAAFNAASIVAHYAGLMLEAVKDHVKRTGPVQHNGRELAVVEEPRRAIDAIAAWETFMALGFDNEDLRRILRVNNKELSEVIRGKAKRGMKAIALRSMKDELEKTGAVKVSTIQKVVPRRQG